MPQSEDYKKSIIDFFKENEIDDLNDRAKIKSLFLENSLTFKRLLRLIINEKIADYYNKNIPLSKAIEEVFPIASRADSMYRLRESLAIKTPKTTFSNLKTKFLILYFLCFFGLSIIAFSVWPEILVTLLSMSYGGLLINGGLVFIPIVLVNMLFPGFLFGNDWPEIKTYNDFLIVVAIDNMEYFSKNEFENAFKELEKALN
jgi:hypothetical protein